MADHPQGSIPRLDVLREIGVSKGRRESARQLRCSSVPEVAVVKGAGGTPRHSDLEMLIALRRVEKGDEKSP